MSLRSIHVAQFVFLGLGAYFLTKEQSIEALLCIMMLFNIATLATLTALYDIVRAGIKRIELKL